ncbi:MAG: sugar ABC transporter substrate-binding protein, partial [Clostridiales bacterium]|nr:sugar ABC transporter substrate-binding protein [Clostridiales bacterium]
MKRKVFAAAAAVAAHVLAITGVLVGFGITSGRERGAGHEKFTGVLERGATIRILENDTAIKQGYFGELIDAFNAKYAEYGIRATDANMDQFSDLENDGPFGYGPDVLYQANDRVMRYAGGYHVQPLPIEDLECYAQIDQKAWDAYKMTVDGEDYYCGVPVNVQGPLLYYRKSLIPTDWQTEWDGDGNGVPDMLESWSALYKFSQQRKAQGKFGYMKSLIDPYFSAGFLFSYGGYIFGGGNTDAGDVGLSKNGAEKGANVLRQLASAMDERCIDYTVTPLAYTQLAKGDFFATMTTPDVYTMFIDALVNEGGYTRAAAEGELGVADIPQLPASGDLTETDPERIPSKMMGGV